MTLPAHVYWCEWCMRYHDPMQCGIESKLWAHVWMALYRPHVQWGGPYPMPAALLNPPAHVWIG